MPTSLRVVASPFGKGKQGRYAATAGTVS
jgi:hypothetical protein